MNCSRPDAITLQQQAGDIYRGRERGCNGYYPESAVAGVINQEAVLTVG